MSEIPVYMIWLGVVALAFALGIVVGCILKGPKTWRPGEVWKLRHDNEAMRLKLQEVGEFIDRHTKS